MAARTRAIVWTALTVVVGCSGSNPNTSDAGGGQPDSGSGSPDAGRGSDGGNGTDAGQPTDAGGVTDAGMPDGGTTVDGGTSGDAGADGGSQTGTVWVVGTGSEGPLFSFPVAASRSPAPLTTAQGAFLHAPRGPVVDSRGNVYVANLVSGVDEVAVFAPSATVPTWTITSADWGNNAGLYAVAIDSEDRLYTLGDAVVASNIVRGVAVFAPDAGANATALTTFTSADFAISGVQAEAIAVDASGNVYVSFEDSRSSGADSVLEFAAGSSGTVTPSRTISGALTNLGVAAVYGLALDGAGTLYVSASGDTLGSRVLAFDSSVTGNAAPTRELAGSMTAFDEPWGIAVDVAGGRLFVANYLFTTGYAVNVFPLDATGDVPPTSTFFLTADGGSNAPVQPWGIAYASH